jgi:hypothetical protein
MNSISSLFTDPKIQQIKKLVFEISKTKYVENEEIIERLCSLILTKHDGEKFIKLIMDIYESGYKKSVNDHKEILEKLGYSVKITGTQSENAG